MYKRQALSLRECTGKPIKFIGTGESVKSFDIFHPERMASRILGMGDVVSLVEKAEKAFDKDIALSSVERLKSGIFTFQDYKDQIAQIKKLGPLSNVMSMTIVSFILDIGSYIYSIMSAKIISSAVIISNL